MTLPIRIVSGNNEGGPSDPVRIVNFDEFIAALSAYLAAGNLEQLIVGDYAGGDYTLFTKDGMRMFGDAVPWDDLEGALIAARITSPSNRIQLNAVNGTVDFQDNCIYPDDYVTLVYQCRHRYQYETDLEPHLHWIQTSALFPNWVIRKRVELNGGAANGAFDAAEIPTSHLYTWAAGSLMQYSDFGDISGVSALSFFVTIKLYRDTTNVSGLYSGADPIVGNVATKSLDIHFRNDMLGSWDELQKYP